MLHGFFAVDHAAAGGDDGVLQVEAQDVVLFDFAEDGQALMVDDLLQRPALNRLDEHIGVEEIPAKRLSQQHADRALAHARHADQHDILAPEVRTADTG